MVCNGTSRNSTTFAARDVLGIGEEGEGAGRVVKVAGVGADSSPDSSPLLTSSSIFWSSVRLSVISLIFFMQMPIRYELYIWN
ncbi:hypothetical protein E2C01_065945 [Portunus trituberculatus]|uniref:Uncharacterized protein n=1 Tax=Portunus trituberculatus TaxID=210409 RepID=A0A5B7HPN8_PORTR|nr:hypothetical protein [Portunus trituberculatus]